MEDDFRNGTNRRRLTFTKDRNIMQTRVYNYSFLSFDREIEENISTDPVARASENKRFDISVVVQFIISVNMRYARNMLFPSLLR